MIYAILSTPVVLLSANSRIVVCRTEGPTLMSGFMKKLQMENIFNRAAYAGPRRFLMMGGAVVCGCSLHRLCVDVRRAEPPCSRRPAGFRRSDPLPGGLHSNPQQDKLALQANQEQSRPGCAQRSIIHAADGGEPSTGVPSRAASATSAAASCDTSIPAYCRAA